MSLATTTIAKHRGTSVGGVFDVLDAFSDSISTAWR